ncbi:EPIDERMAL PATTERNING FACTOR-like protein 6 [Artemisia annua]|uniref:Epidermal patterning factor-like protein n=1 Tax=Artemisia annua TaxID=35608 RepID=A0A2U1L7S3_ARTAN|nr:EPIDERMAL PATTERNING FACTOR-like protein 6 [Artemisia annua]
MVRKWYMGGTDQRISEVVWLKNLRKSGHEWYTGELRLFSGKKYIIYGIGYEMIRNIEKALAKFKTTTISRRRLNGPGSSPPRCAWKCGRCTPCKPIHVPVPPGNPVTAEYYPEAWRCKCGNRLYMP